MSRGPVRRAQLISPFGTGAISVLPDGTAVVAAGLDYWFERDDGELGDIDVTEFEVEEWRLAEALRVSHFRLPPDYRRRPPFGDKDTKNLRMSVPFLRFPRWHFCRRCRLLHEFPLSYREWPQCPECKEKGRRAPGMAQVPFISICDYGHLQDFPWREWVHRSLNPSCSGRMRLRSTGGASLAAQTVECSCGVPKRSLGQITDAAPFESSEFPETFLSKHLTEEGEYRCRGSAPWHGTDAGSTCGLHMRGSLRAASNVYYALVKSSIYLPHAGGDVPAKLMEIIKGPPLSTIIAGARAVSAEPSPAQLRKTQYGNLLQPFTDAQVATALEATAPVTHASSSDQVSLADDESEDHSLPDETDFRRPEFAALRTEQDTAELQVSAPLMHSYEPVVRESFSRIMLIDRLRETRALWGFSRIFPDETSGLRDRKNMLWIDPPDWEYSWLPAYVVHGEGIFFELDEAAIVAFEQRHDVASRIELMASRYGIAQQARQLRRREITPRFVLLHTLAHVLMNQLTFECGYSSAALRERLYVSPGPASMSGFLIYTAAGDAEGTMGGLVRMGKPGEIERVVAGALAAADWCSADPVCMEVGEGGQGPDSCNLAACHSCGLVPETACEEFNRFLDRGLLVGWPTPAGHAPGFFSP